MPNERTSFSDVLNAYDVNDTTVEFECILEGARAYLSFQRKALPKFGALALMLAPDRATPTTPGHIPFVGLALDSVEAGTAPDNVIVLSFGMGPGVVRFGLDKGQAVELLGLLEAAVRQSRT